VLARRCCLSCSTSSRPRAVRSSCRCSGSRGDHRQHAGRPQHPCELGGVPRGEDGGEHVEPGVDDWKGAPRISDPGRQPGMGPGGPPRRRRRDVEGQPSTAQPDRGRADRRGARRAGGGPERRGPRCAGAAGERAPALATTPPPCSVRLGRATSTCWPPPHRGTPTPRRWWRRGSGSWAAVGTAGGRPGGDGAERVPPVRGRPDGPGPRAARPRACDRGRHRLDLGQAETHAAGSWRTSTARAPAAGRANWVRCSSA
jgi:hypothetical protein